MIKRATTLLLDPKYQIVRLGAAFIFYLLLIVIGSIPDARAMTRQVAPGIVLHSVAYAMTTVLLFSGVRGSLFKKAALALVTVLMMGALDEWVQSFFTYRNASLDDWLVDCSAGIVMTFLLFMMWPVNHRAADKQVS